MEIQTTFATIIGFLMMVVVVTATVVIMGGLSKVSVEECHPAEYAATTTAGGKECGYITDVGVAHCERQWVSRILPLTSGYNEDECIDPRNNLCCPTSKVETAGWNVKVINDKCCNITKV